MHRTIGVVGGMGPGAPLGFFGKVLPVRPAPAVVATAPNGEAAGADLIVIPCNTAHYFYQAIQAAVRVPVLHIMQEVAGAASRRFPRLGRVGLLATRATVATGLYQDAFRPLGAAVVVPDQHGQEVIDRLIYAIKAQGVDDALRSPGGAGGGGRNRAGGWG